MRRKAATAEHAAQRMRYGPVQEREKKDKKKSSHDRFSFDQGLPFGNLWKRPFSTVNIEEQSEQSRPQGCV